MVNIKEKRYCAGERSNLKEILPLKFPLSLSVEASSLCNFRCNYCSNSNIKKKSGNNFLSLKDFAKIVDNIVLSGYKLKALNLARLGEPLLNKELPEIIEYAKRSNAFEKILMITNGSLLGQNINKKLINAGLDKIVVSIQGLTALKYFEVSKAKIDFDMLIGNISNLYHNRSNCKIHIKAFRESLDGDIDGFYKIFESICDELSLEHVVPYMVDVDYKKLNCDNNKNRYGDNVRKTDVCPLPFYTMSILSNGDVSCCCVNNHDSLLIGSIHEKSLLEIWNSEKMKLFRKIQISGQREKHPICGKCNFPVYGIQESDNLDDMDAAIKCHYLAV